MDYTNMYNRGMGIPRQQTPIGGGLREMGDGGKVKRYRCMCSNADGVSIECGYYRRPTAKKCSQCCANRGYTMNGFTEVWIDGSDPTALTQKRASGNTGGEVMGGTLREGGGGLFPKMPCYCYDREGNQRICNYFRTDVFSWKCKQCCKRFDGFQEQPPSSDDPTVVRGVSNQYGLPIYSQR